MAKSGSKTKDKKDKKGNKGFEIRTVNTKADRQRPSVFMRLKTDEAFKGVALFEPDPEAADNPGYFEYYDHYDKQGNSYVPCAGAKCPFCKANDNPSTRALTVWYFPQAADVKDQIKVFTMNYSTINDITDEAEDEDGILGKVIRIKRLSDKGDYRVKVTTDKPLTKAELKKALKLMQEKFGDGLVGLVERQLQIQMERLKALDALDDDDDDTDDEEEDDEEEETPKSSKKGKPSPKDEDEEDDDDEEEDEDDEDDDEEENDDEDEDEDSDDEDGDDEDEEESDDEADDEESEITGGVYEVVKIQEKDEIFDLKNDDGKVKMWLGEGVDVDYDAVKKGVTITVDAVQDDEGDWIITALEMPKPKGGKGGKGKGGKKK